MDTIENNFSCYLCPHNCGVDRTTQFGRCRSGREMKICRITPHFYEEPEISGTNGSGTIFFSGCSLDCEFCQNYLISKKYVGRIFSPAQLAEAFKKLEKLGVHNINLVTPTHYSEQIRTAIDIYRPSVPIVYNTSGYEKISSLQKMDPYVDIYLTDFKYSNNEIGMKFSKIKNYYDVCFSAVRYMVDRKPLVFEDGLLKKGVIIRHLILPGQLQNTFDFIDIYKDNFYPAAKLSIMSQFIPCYHSSINRTLKPVENKLVINYLLKKGIDDCNIQEVSSANEIYIPDFQTD